MPRSLRPPPKSRPSGVQKLGKVHLLLWGKSPNRVAIGSHDFCTAQKVKAHFFFVKSWFDLHPSAQLGEIMVNYHSNIPKRRPSLSNCNGENAGKCYQNPSNLRVFSRRFQAKSQRHSRHPGQVHVVRLQNQWYKLDFFLPKDGMMYYPTYPTMQTISNQLDIF